MMDFTQHPAPNRPSEMSAKRAGTMLHTHTFTHIRTHTHSHTLRPELTLSWLIFLDEIQEKAGKESDFNKSNNATTLLVWGKSEVSILEFDFISCVCFVCVA